MIDQAQQSRARQTAKQELFEESFVLYAKDMHGNPDGFDRIVVVYPEHDPDGLDDEIKFTLGLYDGCTLIEPEELTSDLVWLLADATEKLEKMINRKYQALLAKHMGREFEAEVRGTSINDPRV